MEEWINQKLEVAQICGGDYLLHQQGLIRGHKRMMEASNIVVLEL